MVAQLLLEEVDHARSLLLGTIAKYASQYINEWWACRWLLGRLYHCKCDVWLL